MFLSINNGITWTAFNDGWLNTCVLSLALNGTDLFAATVGGGVWKRSVSNLVPKNFDAAVYQLLSPTDAGVGSASVISAKIDNTGLNPIGNFPVSCYVDGNLFATSIINSTIASMGSLDFIFPGTIDLSSRGEHTIKIIAGLTNDQNHANDTLITGIFASGTTVTAIGETYYDLQTNASCQNRLVRFSDGTTGGTWTMGTLYPGFPDRGTGYNSQQNSAWSSFPTDRIENVRTGWPSYAPWGSNGEIICAHTNTTNGLRISSRTTKGSGSWITANKPGPAGHEILNWPRMVTSGTNHDYLHIVALTIPVSSGGTLYNGQNSALLYSRSPDGGVTWDINNVQLPQTDTNFYYALVGDNCSFTAKGNTLAFVYGSTWTDVFLLKSTDNGTTWIKTLIFQNPYPKFTETTTLVTDTFTGCDGSLSVCLDANGIAHVFFGIRKTLNNNLSDGVTSYFSNSDGLAYWNETMPAFTTLDYQSLKDQNKLVGYVQDLNGNGIVKEFDGEGNYYSSLTSTPVSCIDNSGYIYVVFSSVMEGLSNGWQSYRQLWVRRSNNGGLTWGDFIRLNSTVGNSYSECVFPSLAENSDNNLYLLYQSDPEPGMAVTGDMDPFGVNTINVMTIPKTLFASPKIRTTLETVTGCPGNIAVKISVTNLSNVSSISLSFYYNNSILTYQGYQDLNPALASGTLLINPLANKINLAWFSLTPISISNGVLLEIKFSGNSGVSQLTWDSITPGACYFTDPVGNPLQANYTDGALNIGTCTHIMGNISYFNTSNTNISNTNLLLKKNNSTIATTTTNSSGQYHFTGISQTGAVNISVHCTKTWGGVNAIDALKAMQHFVGISPLTGLRLACADVDGNGFVNAADALLIMRRFVGLQISFASGDWIFENPAITIIPNDTVYQDIKGLCVGDIDCSYVPAARETPLCYIDPHGSYPLLPGKTLEVPVNIGQDAVLGSVSLIMKIPEGIVINDVQPELRGEFIFNVIGNELRIAWYSIESQILKSNDLLFTMIIRQEKLTESWVALPGSILADPMGNGLVSFPLWIPEASPVSGKNWLGDNSPNPFSEITSIPFGLCEVSDICLIISNLTGEEVSLTNLDHVPAGMHAIDFHKSLVKPGVYFYTLEIKTAKSYWKSTKRMIVR
ncbi:MAG: cohesin domain-containing protein [Bacteroidetes bacterium]|nr:cohesin domain-containing protein [Bacteroidota bacterium]